MEGKLLNRNGKMFVLLVTPRWYEPIIDYQWCQVTHDFPNSNRTERPMEGDTARYDRSGRWLTTDPETLRSTGGVYTGDGNEVATSVESVSAPMPKIRGNLERRWECGRWEKKLKKGWVPA